MNAMGHKKAGQEKPGWEHIASKHYENFPVGSFLIERERRKALRAVYAFARTADDIADETRDSTGARAMLSGFRKDFEDALHGKSVNPLFVEIGNIIRKWNIEESLFFDLLSAFEQDTWKKRYATRDELLDYCRRSANPVGRIVLRIHGRREKDLDAFSDNICTALQIANFLQDVREDYLERGRIYIPKEDMEGWDESVILNLAPSSGFLSTVRKESRWVRELLEKGFPLTRALKGRLALEVRVIVRSCFAVLKSIEEAGFDVLSDPSRLRLGKLKKAMILVSSLFGFNKSRYNGR